MRELRHFGTVFLYLALGFGVFALHQFVVLANNGMCYTFYGASLINAAILAKIMHVAEAFHFGEQFEDKPLAFPILYKSVAFGLLLVVAYVVEEVVVGLLRGHSLAQSMPDLGGGTLAGLAAVAVIMCVALIPFFAFRGDADGWISLSQPELAKLVAISVPTLQQVMRRFTGAGLVRSSYARIQVMDRDALVRFCRG